MATRINFTLPADLIESLKANVRERERSSFVADALREKLAEIERERLKAELIAGYKAMAEEGRRINAEWEAITLESWPEDDDDD